MTEYGVQMYCLRDITKDSMRMALEKTAAMGYKSVEFAGFFDYTAEQIKIWLDAFGLTASGTHTSIEALADDKIDATIAYHKTIGCDRLIVPGANWSDEAHMEANVATLNKAQPKLAEAGIILGYHNHSDEFYETPYGKIVEDEVARRTSVELEIDTFWLFNTGRDVIATLESLKDRIRIVHLKDGKPSPADSHAFGRGQRGAVGLAVGEGDAPVREVRAWALANGVKMVIESEGLQPTGLEEIGRCITFLKSLEE